MELLGPTLTVTRIFVSTRGLLMIDGMIGMIGVVDIVNHTGEFTAGLILGIIILLHCGTTDGDYLDARTLTGV